MALSEDVRGRLVNWKFSSAARYVRDEGPDGPATDEETALIGALDRLFGNVGWFEGDMAFLVEMALRRIGLDDDDDEVR